MGLQALTDQPCDGGEGTCNEQGECLSNIPPTCEARFPDYSYNQNNQVCQEELTPGTLTCEFYLDRGGNPINNGQNFSCDSFCARANATCVSAWNDNNASCNRRNETQACNASNWQTYLCRCELPL